MSKRNSKSSNVSSVVVVRCTALKMGAFSSSCSKLCNEWLLMSVHPAEAEVRWFKRNWESTGTMRESTGTGHTGGDHVLVTVSLRAVDSVSYFHRRFSLPVSAWAALQIQPRSTADSGA